MFIIIIMSSRIMNMNHVSRLSWGWSSTFRCLIYNEIFFIAKKNLIFKLHWESSSNFQTWNEIWGKRKVACNIKRFKNLSRFHRTVSISHRSIFEFIYCHNDLEWFYGIAWFLFISRFLFPRDIKNLINCTSASRFSLPKHTI